MKHSLKWTLHDIRAFAVTSLKNCQQKVPDHLLLSPQKDVDPRVQEALGILIGNSRLVVCDAE